MKKVIAVAALALGMVGVTQADPAFRIKAAYALGGKYEIKTSTGGQAEADINPYTVSASLVADSVYADASFGASSNDKLTGVTGALDRQDITLTVGTTDALSVFGGYKQGKSELNNTLKTVFKSQGFFVGLAPSFAIAEGSRVGLSGAIAFMSGSWDDTTSSDDADYTFGYSLGAAYSYQFNPNLSAGVDVKYQAYDFDFKTNLGMTVDETMLQYGANIAYRF